MGIPLTQDHKPELPRELQRIWTTPDGYVELYSERVFPETLGAHKRTAMAAQAQGKKALYRVNRDLALSRAMGDRDLKSSGVISRPEITVHEVDQTRDRFLVVACDGVWDTMSSRQCARLVRSVLDKNAHLPPADRAQTAAEQLVGFARNSPACNDDTVALVVLLRQKVVGGGHWL